MPTPEHYGQQSRTHISLSQDQHLELINRYVSAGMSVLHVHTHPGSCQPVFSATDNFHEARYASFLNSFRPKAHFISAVFDQDMNQSTWRSWNLATGDINYNVRVDMDDSAKHLREFDAGVLNRQQIFGEDFLRRLGELSVTIIGCGGIGSVFVEQLTRLGVLNWVLIDPDRIEESNLNRTPFAAKSDVGEFKTNWVAGLVQRIWQDRASIMQVPKDISDSEAKMEAVKSDYIVVASDNHHSRAVTQELASRFVRPLISMATQIYKAENTEARYHARLVSPPVAPNTWSLISSGAVNLHRAAQEVAPDKIKEDMVNQGYIDDVRAPAVYWLNSLCASLGVKLIQEKVLGDHHENGVDWYLECGRNLWHSISHDNDRFCLYTSNRDDGLFGRGFDT